MIKSSIVYLCCALMLCNSVFAEQHNSKKSFPDQFTIGRHTFFDFGPPFDFYEIFSVHATGKGTSIDRITVTPPGDACLQPATVQTETASISESIPDLMGKTNPCTIPEKNLRRELKRCKKCMVFSGADVTMQMQCGDTSRLIRMDILDKDMFEPAPKTPEHTSWTMTLLAKLDQPFKTSVMNRPMFPFNENNSKIAANTTPETTLNALDSGRFDALFAKAPHKPSELYKEARLPHIQPNVALISSSPFSPITPILPTYPPIAKAAHQQGQVTVILDVDATGKASNLSFVDGKRLLQNTTASAVANWRFQKEAIGKHIEAVINFDLNCPLVHP